MTSNHFVLAGAEGAGRAEVSQVVHGRSRMTIDPRFPTLPGRARWVFVDLGDIVCTKHERFWARRIKGVGERKRSRALRACGAKGGSIFTVSGAALALAV